MRIPTSRNPVLTSSRNPLTTSSINPLYTSSLNPLSTSSINPQKTSSLNPLRTFSISPMRTSSLNYLRTSSKNPMRTSSINPHRTSSINPVRSSSIPGLYMYDLNMTVLGFTVLCAPDFQLIFDTTINFCAVAVQVNEKYCNLHDLQGSWIGYMVHAHENTWLKFDLNRSWEGFTS